MTLSLNFCSGSSYSLPTAKQLATWKEKQGYVTPSLPVTVTSSTLTVNAGNNNCSFCFDVVNFVMSVAIESGGELVIFYECLAVICESDPICGMFCFAYVSSEFQERLNQTGLDPVTFCQQEHYCPVADCNGNCASITSLKAQPEFGLAPTTFHFPVTWHAEQTWTGTGTFYMAAYGPIGMGEADFVGDSIVLLQGFTKGPQEIKFSMDCDQNWFTGNYTALVQICEGFCGEFGPGRHPHTRVFASDRVDFACENDALSTLS